jgi:hypothetical protein
MRGHAEGHARLRQAYGAQPPQRRSHAY